MLAFGVTIILVQLLQIFYAQDSIVIPNSSITTEAQAADILAEIRPDEVLPLVLFQEEHESENPILGLPELSFLQAPKNIIQAEIINGRLVKGTEFAYSSNTQTFFCPKQDSEDECLAPQEFDEGQQLECKREPLPMVYPDGSLKGPCGDTGNSHYIGYEICPNEHQSYTHVTNEIPLYGFCYDKEKKNTIYMTYFIPSPNLLKSLLLFRERGVKYPILIDDEFKPSNLQEIDETEIRELNSTIHPEKQFYKLQMLVSEANMAVALWRKTTYRNFNLDWQHEALILLWDRINRNVRSHASELSKTNTKILARTGVLDIDPGSKNKVHMFNIWVNMITTVPPQVTMEPTGIVILMNNFIRNATKTDDGSSTIPKAIEEAIENYCKENLCVNTLIEEFERVGGRIRCCSFSTDNVEVWNLFDITKNLNTNRKIYTLRIPGVTTTKNSKNIMRY